MRTVNELLDQAKTAQGIETDMALAKALGVGRAAVSTWRHGTRLPDAVACATIAGLAGLPLAKVLGIVGEARAISREEKAVWRKLAATAAMLAIAYYIAPIAAIDTHHGLLAFAFAIPAEPLNALCIMRSIGGARTSGQPRRRLSAHWFRAAALGAPRAAQPPAASHIQRRPATPRHPRNASGLPGRSGYRHRRRSRSSRATRWSSLATRRREDGSREYANVLSTPCHRGAKRPGCIRLSRTTRARSSERWPRVGHRRPNRPTLR